jgi:hypothetical protein
MNTVELVHFSLGFAFQVLEGLVADLTQEQADWVPPGNANPIGATYWHIIMYVDKIVHDWGMGQAALRDTADWQERVVAAGPETLQTLLASLAILNWSATPSRVPSSTLAPSSPIPG